METLSESSKIFPVLQLEKIPVFLWNLFGLTTSFLFYVSTVYFLLEQGNSFCRHKKYSIRKSDLEKQEERNGYVTKICILVVIHFSLGTQSVLPMPEVLDLPNGFIIWIHILIVIPAMIVKRYFEARFKFSLESAFFMNINSETLHLMLLLARETMLILDLIVKPAFGATHAWSLGSINWTTCALSVLRFVSAISILYLDRKSILKTAHHVANEKVSQDSLPEETKTKKNLSPSAIWAQFYSFRIYFIPGEFLAKLSFFVFLGFIGLDAFVDLYSSITYRRILDSLHFTDGSSSISRPNLSSSSVDASAVPSPGVGAIRLEYRWDYLVTYAIIKFSQYNIVGHLKYYLKKHVETSCCCKLQMDLFSKLHELSLRWHLENKPVEVFSLMTSGPSILKDILSGLCWVTPECLIMVVQLVYLVNSYSYKLSGIVISTAVVSVILDVCVLRWRDKTLVNLSDAQKEARSARADSFENFETVKYFTNEAFEKDKFKKSYLDEQHQYMKSGAWQSVSTTVRELMQGIAELGVILIVVRGIINEEGLTAGDYIYFSGLFTKIMYPVESVMEFYKKLQENAIELEKIMKVLTMTPEIIDEPNAPLLKISASGGSIEFRNVNFSYTPDRQILSNVNFFIPAGKTVAFVGHSGCGKSTIAKLLFRFYDPTSGEILVDGQNIRNVQCDSLRKLIGVVPQDVVLFDETVKENIRYGDLNATEESIVAAAKLASVHGRIESFPDKYNTKVGSRGLKLSGGEKQRIALARTIVKNPPIVILDEATSSLDTETERQIQSSLNSLCRNRTCFIIAHRLSTIVHADKVVVLKNGKVDESGTHEELVAKNGSYTNMWNQQFVSAVQTNKIVKDSDTVKPRIRIRIEDFSSNSTIPAS